MNNKSKKLNIFICLIGFIVMLVYFVFIDGENVLLALGKIKVGWLVAALGLMVGYWLTEAYSLHAIIKCMEKKHKFKNTLVVTMIGQYFNCVTPFATGGQPMQAYYLTKFNLSLGTSMSSLILRFIVYQVVLTIYSAVLLFCRFDYFQNDLRALRALTIVGFAINTVVVLALLMVAFFKNTARKIAHFVIKLLGKLRIIKSPDERLRFIDEEMEQYSNNMKFIRSQPLAFIKASVATIIQLTFYFSITFALYLGFGLSTVDYLTIMSCQAFVLMISSFVPLPGAMGAAEGSYAAFFHPIFGEYTGFSMFVWRFLTFYLTIIVGLLTNLFADKFIRRSKQDTENAAS